MVLSRQGIRFTGPWSRSYIAYGLLHIEHSFTQRPHLHSSTCPKTRYVRTRQDSCLPTIKKPLSCLIQLTQLLPTKQPGSLLIQLRSSPAKACVCGWLRVLKNEVVPCKTKLKVIPGQPGKPAVCQAASSDLWLALSRNTVSFFCTCSLLTCQCQRSVFPPA